MKIILVGILILVLIICFVGIFMQRQNEKRDYNNGICPKCGGKYEHSKALQLSGERDYVCNKCGHSITVSYNID